MAYTVTTPLNTCMTSTKTSEKSNVNSLQSSVQLVENTPNASGLTLSQYRQSMQVIDTLTQQLTEMQGSLKTLKEDQKKQKETMNESLDRNTKVNHQLNAMEIQLQEKTLLSNTADRSIEYEMERLQNILFQLKNKYDQTNVHLKKSDHKIENEIKKIQIILDDLKSKYQQTNVHMKKSDHKIEHEIKQIQITLDDLMKKSDHKIEHEIKQMQIALDDLKSKCELSIVQMKTDSEAQIHRTQSLVTPLELQINRFSKSLINLKNSSGAWVNHVNRAFITTPFQTIQTLDMMAQFEQLMQCIRRDTNILNILYEEHLELCVYMTRTDGDKVDISDILGDGFGITVAGKMQAIRKVHTNDLAQCSDGYNSNVLLEVNNLLKRITEGSALKSAPCYELYFMSHQKCVTHFKRMVKYSISEALQKVGYGIRMPNTELIVYAPVSKVDQFHKYSLQLTPTAIMLQEGSCLYSFLFGPFEHTPYVDLVENPTLLTLIGAMFDLNVLTPESLIVHEFSMRTNSTSCNVGEIPSSIDRCTFNTLHDVREFIKHSKVDEYSSMALYIHFSVRHHDTFTMKLGQQGLALGIHDTFSIHDKKEGLPITHAFTGCFRDIR